MVRRKVPVEDYDPEDLAFGGHLDGTSASKKKRVEMDHLKDVLTRKKSKKKLTPENELGEGKYEGVKVSRKEIFPSAQDDEQVHDFDDDGDLSFEDVDEENLPTTQLYKELREMHETEESSLRLVKEQFSSDRERGMQVRNQLKLWEKVLDLRVTLQPLLAHSLLNQEQSRVRTRTGKLFKSLLTLRSQLMQADGVEWRQEGTSAEAVLEAMDKALLTQAKKEIEKWHQKTLLSNPLLDFKKLRKLSTINQSPWSQMEAILRSKPVSPLFEGDPDFYQGLLREWVDQRQSLTGAVQVVRVSKGGDRIKREDVGSKGRKLKFDVQEKLVNYMVPNADPFSWEDDKIDEFIKSLLN